MVVGSWGLLHPTLSDADFSKIPQWFLKPQQTQSSEGVLCQVREDHTHNHCAKAHLILNSAASWLSVASPHDFRATS